MKWWEEQNVGYNYESDDEHDITWDDDLKKGAGDDDNTEKVMMERKVESSKYDRMWRQKGMEYIVSVVKLSTCSRTNILSLQYN